MDRTCRTRKDLVLNGVVEIELNGRRRQLGSTGLLLTHLGKNEVLNPVTLSTLSVDTPGDKKSLPV